MRDLARSWADAARSSADVCRLADFPAREFWGEVVKPEVLTSRTVTYNRQKALSDEPHTILSDESGVGPGLAQMWQRSAQSSSRCRNGEPGPGADVAAVSPIPVQMWQR